MARNDDDDGRDLDDDDDKLDDEPDEEQPRKKKKKGPTKDEKQMAMFAHLGVIVVGFIGPLIIYMMKKDESRFIERHAREALNFSITVAIVGIVGGLVTCGILAIVVSIYAIVACIQAGMAANRGERYEYSMCFRMVN